MKAVNETLVKYLAGLCDSDGTLTFNFSKNCCRLHLSISNVKERFEALSNTLVSEIGGISYTLPIEGHQTQLRWFLTKRADLEMLLPRLIKHMVIKGRHWQTILVLWRENRGKALSDSELKVLKNRSVESRANVGPVAAKSHPTWAWTAGYLDGDGCYCNRYHKARKQWHQHVSVNCDPKDRIGVELLQKAFGGKLYDHKGGWLNWRLQLTPGHAKFAIPFLGKMARHSQMKRRHVEEFIHTIRQRLSDRTLNGEAIV